MATQHPDNAGKPFWHDQAFISAETEIEEMYQNFFQLGCEEYMWDWEGKFADEAIIEKLLGKYFTDFQKKQLGKNIFLTLRIPNIWEEKTFKLARAYMSVLSAAEFTESLKLATPPVFEFILPMTKSSNQLLHIQKTFQKTAQLHEEIFGETNFKKGYIHIIPLFESVDDLAGCAKILTAFIQQHQKNFQEKPAYIRAFIARSDPALNAGFIPAVLAVRLALREFYRISHLTQIPIYPIIGTGSLPFRGGVNPENIEKILKQYEGVKTITIQSAFRYDYSLEEVKKALTLMKKKLSKVKPLIFSDKEFSELKKIIKIFQQPYCKTIEAASVFINEMASHIPKRRERVQHIGLFGYSRGIGKTRLPRAITFTSAWYSLGIPPEFIGTGRGLKKIIEQGLMPMLEKHFFTLRSELIHAGKYVNYENLDYLSKKYTWASSIREDIDLCSKILDIQLGPQKEQHLLHRNLTSTLILKKRLGLDFSSELVEAGIMRKSLG